MMFWNGLLGEASDIATRSENSLTNEPCIRRRIVSRVLSLHAKIADVFEAEILYREILNWWQKKLGKVWLQTPADTAFV